MSVNALNPVDRSADEESSQMMEPKSSLVSRNITVSGRRTSVRLEQEMWNALKDIALREKCTIHDICSLIDMRKNRNTSLTAAIRVFLMLYYRAAATDDGHRRAGHGSFETMRQRARLRAETSIFVPRREENTMPLSSAPSPPAVASRSATS